LVNKKNESFKNIINDNLDNIANVLVQDMLIYNSNTFLQNKILKIFELLLNEESYPNISAKLSARKEIYDILVKNIDFNAIMNKEK
jgi:hypothetical protein